MVKLIWKQGLQFVAEDEYNHKIIVDTDIEYGGLDQGFRPAELMLVSLAGCMSMDIVSIVQKKGGTIKAFEASVQGIRDEKHPKPYKKIHVKFSCNGDYERTDLLRAFELSRDKYCGVFATLQTSPEIEFDI